MNGALADASVILDVFLNDPLWADRSESILEKYAHFPRVRILSPKG